MKDDLVVKEETYKGYTIRVGFDEWIYDDYNPRQWDGNLTTMLCFHKRYKLGDEQLYNSEDYNSWDEVQDEILRNEDVVAIKPLYMYDHSGITISTNPWERGWYHAAWDSGQIGFVYVTRESVMKVMNWKRISKKRRLWLIDQLLAEVKQYDQYLRNELYVVEIVDQETEEIVDCCGGMYGEPEEIFQDAKSQVNYY